MIDKDYQGRSRILFCNIAYMKYYNNDITTDKPQYGGSYVKDTGNANESMNFHVFEDGKIYGFVETKHYGSYKNSGKANDLHIEKIDNNFKNLNEITGVTVVFCAYSSMMKNTVIVGWYRNATVYRKRMFKDNIEYNILTTQPFAYLLDENERTFVVPRAKGSGVGFGQSNLWYADKSGAANFVNEVLVYLTQKEKAIECVAKTSEIKRTNKMKILDLKLPISVEKTEFNAVEEAEYLQEVESTFMSGEEIANYDPVPNRAVPTEILSGSTKYVRDPKQSQFALKRANHKCEFNSDHESFSRISDGTKYTESHHLIPISQQDHFDYSLDVPANIVSLCSTCHNCIHYGREGRLILKSLYEQRKDELEKAGIFIDFETLFKMYY